MLKLKLRYFGHLMWRVDSFEKTLMLGKIEGRRRRARQRMRWLGGITNSMDMSLVKFRELVMDQGGLVCCGAWCHKEPDTTEWLNWTELSMGFSRQECWSVLPFPSPVDHHLSELLTQICLSWVTLHSMLMASFSYISSFITTRLWSTKRPIMLSARCSHKKSY